MAALLVDGAAADMATAPAGGRIRVWDPVVRLFHWSMVGGFALNMFLVEDGEAAHRWIGYAVLAAIAVRLVWGFVGTPHARYGDFLPTPTGLYSYLRDLARGRERRFVGHNPAGAVMMVLLIGLMLACGVSGWMLGLDRYWGSEWLEELHGALAYAILGMAGLHVLAAIIESVRHGENLIWSMITGFKRAPRPEDVDHAAAARRG